MGSAAESDSKAAEPCCQCAGDGARVVFIGNPNVGKSSLFNAMLGMHAKVMNAPGTTVLLEHGTYRYEGQGSQAAGQETQPQEWDFTDTPGTYSLLPMSPDEEVAVEAVTGANGRPQPDLIVAALDATNLSRSLYFLAQVLELGKPTVVALTMTDLARKQKSPVDAARLSKALGGVPVVAVDGRVGSGCDALADAIADGLVHGTPMPHGLAAQPTEGATMKQWVRSRSDERFEWASQVLARVGMGGNSGLTASDRIDRVLLHPVWGIVVFLIVMFAVFQATTTLAGPAQDWFDVTVRGWCETGIDWVFGLFGPGAADGWFHSLIVNGLLDGVITVATFIPPMGIMFILLSLLEDCGYLARAAFVMDRAMRALGLDGRAFLPIVVGFGCNLPGLAATRTLPDSRQRVLVGMLIPFASCSARLSVYLVLAYAFFEHYAGLVVFLMYVMSIIVILLVGLVLKHTAFRSLAPEPFVMSLPPYQCPRAIALLRTVWSRLWGFLTGASSIIISMILVLWLLEGIPLAGAAGSFGNVEDVHDSAYGVVADAVAPVFKPAGFGDWHASAALITGFVAKEVVVGAMSQSYSIEQSDDESEAQEGQGALGVALREDFDKSSGGHGRAAAVAFLLFVLAYTPCLATVAELRRQFGGKVAIATVGIGLVVAYALAVMAFQTLKFVL
ncbi:MAG: ferrous iron transport protein B [Bifidobacteriaceae bacterium]|nr:ferrous iron transport protein B [Bifidobacteriaceae bacterium]